MTRIRIKRVYEAPAPDDGCRVLALLNEFLKFP